METPEPRRGVRKPPKYPTVAEEVVETDALRSEHAVIQAPGGLLRFTASAAKPGADTEQIEADWQAARARTAALAESYRRPLERRAAPKIAAPRSRAPRPAAPHRRGSRRSADKDDDPDDGT